MCTFRAAGSKGHGSLPQDPACCWATIHWEFTSPRHSSPKCKSFSVWDKKPSYRPPLCCRDVFQMCSTGVHCPSTPTGPAPSPSTAWPAQALTLPAWFSAHQLTSLPSLPGSLNVYLRLKGQTAIENPLWSSSGNKGQHWNQARVNINPPTSFQVRDSAGLHVLCGARAAPGAADGGIRSGARIHWPLFLTQDFTASFQPWKLLYGQVIAFLAANRWALQSLIMHTSVAEQQLFPLRGKAFQFLDNAVSWYNICIYLYNFRLPTGIWNYFLWKNA